MNLEKIVESFVLHPILATDCHVVGDWGLSRVLLLDDCRYPWLLLVPRCPNLTEIYQLPAEDRAVLLEESCRLGEFLMDSFDGDKLNIGALGNLVPQLHLHHVVRRAGDPAWPGPVWGHSPAQAYEDEPLTERLGLLRGGLGIKTD